MVEKSFILLVRLYGLGLGPRNSWAEPGPLSPPLLQLLFVLLLLFLQCQGSLTLLYQLDTTVGDKQDCQGGLGEACWRRSHDTWNIPS